jgi:undecaprenyl-diphosphatase
VTAFPALASVLVPFAVLVAASRVILGLHYPTDVLAGAAIGYGVAEAVLHLV